MTIDVAHRWLIVVWGLAAVALSPGHALAAPRAAELGPEAPLAQPAGGYVGRLGLTPEHGPAGTPVSVTGDGFPADGEFQLVWRTVKGRWKVTHAQYHRPEDDTNLINFIGLENVVDYVWRVSQQIEALPATPQFVRVKGVSQPAGGRNFRVYLGTIPDYTEEVKGVKLTGVREGSPAQAAGIQGGDVIVEFGGKTIENIYDYTYALQEHKPGDIVTIVVLRDGKRIPLQVTLAKRTGE